MLEAFVVRYVSLLPGSLTAAFVALIVEQREADQPKLSSAGNVQLLKTGGTGSLVMRRAVGHDFTLEIFDVVQNRIAVIIGQ